MCDVLLTMPHNLHHQHTPVSTSKRYSKHFSASQISWECLCVHLTQIRGCPWDSRDPLRRASYWGSGFLPYIWIQSSSSLLKHFVLAVALLPPSGRCLLSLVMSGSTCSLQTPLHCFFCLLCTHALSIQIPDIVHKTQRSVLFFPFFSCPLLSGSHYFHFPISSPTSNWTISNLTTDLFPLLTDPSIVPTLFSVF